MITLLAAPQKAVANGAKGTFALEERLLPQVVTAPYNYPAGTIAVFPRDRYLYLVEGGGLARRYGIGVGRAGLAFSGSATIGRKAKWPSWRPTKNMIRRDPKKYARYAGGVPGGPNNPLACARSTSIATDGTRFIAFTGRRSLGPSARPSRTVASGWSMSMWRISTGGYRSEHKSSLSSDGTICHHNRRGAGWARRRILPEKRWCTVSNS